MISESLISLHNSIMNNDTDLTDNTFYFMTNTENLIYEDKDLTNFFTSDNSFPSYPSTIVHNGCIFGYGIHIHQDSIDASLVLHGCDLRNTIINNITFSKNILQNCIFNNFTNLSNTTFDMSSNQMIRDSSGNLFTSDESFPSYPKIKIVEGNIVGPYVDFSEVNINSISFQGSDLRNCKFYNHSFTTSDFSGCIMNNSTIFNNCIFQNFKSDLNIIYDETGEVFTSDTSFFSYPELIVYKGHFFGKGIECVEIPETPILYLSSINISNLVFPEYTYESIIMDNSTNLTNVFFSNLDITTTKTYDGTDSVFTSHDEFQSYPSIQVQNGYIFGPGIVVSNLDFINNEYNISNIDFHHSTFNTCNFKNIDITNTNFSLCEFTNSSLQQLFFLINNTTLVHSSPEFFPSHPNIKVVDGYLFGPGMNTSIFNFSLRNFDLTGVHFDNASLNDFDLYGIKIDQHTTFTNTSMNIIRSGNIDFDTQDKPFDSNPKIHIKKGYVLGSGNQTDLIDIDFSQIYINNITLNDNLSNCDFTMSEFYNIDMTSATINSNKVDYLLGYNLTPSDKIFNHFYIVNSNIITKNARYKNAIFDGSILNVPLYFHGSNIRYKIENCLFQNFVGNNRFLNMTFENIQVVDTSFINCQFDNSTYLSNHHTSTYTESVSFVNSQYDIHTHNGHFITSGVYFLPDTNLDNLDISNITLHQFIAPNCIFTNSNLFNISFYHSNLINSNFNSSTLQLKDISNTFFTDSNFDNAKIIVNRDLSYQFTITDLTDTIGIVNEYSNAFIYNNIVVFNGANLTNYDLSYLSVSNETILSSCNFAGSNLSNASFNGNDLLNCNFSNANMLNLTSSDNYLLDENIKRSSGDTTFVSSPETILVNGYIAGSYVNLRDLSFQNITFEGTDFTGTDFYRTDLTGSNFDSIYMNNDTDLSYTVIDNVMSNNILTYDNNILASEQFTSSSNFSSFPDTIIVNGYLFGEKVHLDKINITNYIFEKTNFKGIKVIDGSFVDCDFSGIQINNHTDFSNCSFSGTSSHGLYDSSSNIYFSSNALFASHPDVVIVNGYLIAKNTVLKNSYFENITFHSNDFRGIDFSGSTFLSCHFENIKINHQTNFTNCIFTNSTSNQIQLFDSNNNPVNNTNTSFPSHPKTIVINNFIINIEMDLHNVVIQNAIFNNFDFLSSNKKSFDSIFKEIKYESVEFVNILIADDFVVPQSFFKIKNEVSQRCVFVYYENMDIDNMEQYFKYDDYVLSLKTHIPFHILYDDSCIRLYHELAFDGMFYNIYLISEEKKLTNWKGFIFANKYLQSDSETEKNRLISIQNVNVIGGNTYVSDTNESGGGLLRYNSNFCELTQCTSSININLGGGGLVGSQCQYIYISKCYTRNNFNNGSNIGGIIGSYAQFCEMNECYSTVTVNSRSGGLIGSFSNNCTVSDSYTSSFSYEDSVISLTDDAGSIFGIYCKDCTVQNCYSTSPIYPIFGKNGENNTIKNTFNNKQFIDSEETNLITNLLLNTEIQFSISDKFVLDTLSTNQYPLLKCFTQPPWNENYYRNYNAHASPNVDLGDVFYMQDFNLFDSLFENIHIDSINISRINFNNCILKNVTSSNLTPINSNKNNFYSEPQYIIRDGVLVGSGVDISGFQGLSGEDLDGINFENTNITNVSFYNVTSKNLLPTHYDFSGVGVDAIIRNGHLVTSWVNLNNANLSNTTINLNELHDVKLYNANLTNISFHKTWTYSIEPEYSGILENNDIIGHPYVTIFNGSIITEGVFLKEVNLQYAYLSKYIKYTNITSENLLPRNSTYNDYISQNDKIYILNGILFANNVIIDNKLDIINIKKQMNINYHNNVINDTIEIITETNNAETNFNNMTTFVRDNKLQIYNVPNISAYRFLKK